MDAYRNVVVVVHGGADTPPGTVLGAVAAALPGPPGSYQRSDLVLGHDVYPRLVNVAPSLPDLIETPCGPPLAPGSPAAGLRRLLGLIAGLPAVRHDRGSVDPARRTRQVHREVAEGVLLWSLWPVLLTLLHSVGAAAARPNRILLDAALLALLGLLVRSQWRAARRVAVAGCGWFTLCLGLSLVLWNWPQLRPAATTVSIRAYGLGQLMGALVLVAMAVETGLSVARQTVPWRRGLTTLALAVVPFGLASLLAACLWALVLNTALVLGSGPVLEALKGWQQTFVRSLGYGLAPAEWGAAATTVLLALLAVAGALHTRRATCGETARRWLLISLAVVALGGVLVALGTVLTSPFLRAPLAGALRRIGPNSDAAGVFTWSALRLVPWLLLLLSPLRGTLTALADAGLLLLSPAGDPEPPAAGAERLRRLLGFLDRGRHDRIHLLAHGQGAVAAMDALHGGEYRHALVLTTLGNPAGPLHRDLLGRPMVPAPVPADWCNLYRRGDPLGGPVGAGAADVPLDGVGHEDYWSEPLVADRVIQVMQAPA